MGHVVWAPYPRLIGALRLLREGVKTEKWSVSCGGTDAHRGACRMADPVGAVQDVLEQVTARGQVQRPAEERPGVTITRVSLALSSLSLLSLLSLSPDVTITRGGSTPGC